MFVCADELREDEGEAVMMAPMVTSGMMLCEMQRVTALSEDVGVNVVVAEHIVRSSSGWPSNHLAHETETPGLSTPRRLTGAT